jgi:transcriptional regulator with XRE-family HTH domain
MGFKEIGKKIQQAREEKGLTQADLAQALGLTQAALSNYELGKRRLYLHQIEDIARHLQRDLEFFISSEEMGGADRSAKASRMREQAMSRIRDMGEAELRSLLNYIDFLAWRKNHG